MVLTLFVHVIAFHVFSPTTCHQSISTSPCFLLPCQLLYSMQVVINLSLAWPQPSRSGGVGACQLALGSRGVGVVSCAARMPPKKVAAPVLTEPTGASSASGSGKRPAVPDATNDVTVPAKAAKVQAPAVVVLVKPKLPKAVGSARELPAKQMMRKIVPWVNQELEKFLHRELMLKHHENLRDLKPLSVSAKEKDAVGTSYKQPWVPENAKLSMTLNGLYEAGAVLFWIDPETTTDNFTVPCVDPTWGVVQDISETGFDPIGMSGSQRIMFPVSFSTKFVGAIPEHTYMTRLILLGGHAFVYAWYVKALRALEAENNETVRMLVEAALTVTVTAWSNPFNDQVAVLSIKLSEAIRVEAKVMCDSFISFMDKIAMSQSAGESGSIPQTCVPALQKQNVRFNGGLINVSMIKAMNTLRGLMTPQARELMTFIERRHGFDVLTASYNKLRMLANGCQGRAQAWSGAWRPCFWL